MRITPLLLSMLAACPMDSAFAPGDRAAAFPIEARRHHLVVLDLSSSSAVNNNNNEASVQVYDNVFTPLACDALSSLALEHRERANGSSSLFYRSSDKPYTALECAIDSVLSALEEDDAEVVEYWSRHEYVNIDAHADIDERLLWKTNSQLRCPDRGHVAYLRLGPGVRGPTVVFPDRKKGWRTANSGGGVRLVTIPAVVGRILRFEGEAMHAVPKPADRWLMNNVDEMILRHKETNEDSNNNNGGFWMNDDAQEAEEKDNTGDDVRVVLLFNTWKIPPMGVGADPAREKLPSKKKQPRKSKGNNLNNGDIRALLAQDPSTLNSKQRRILRRHHEREGHKNKDASAANTKPSSTDHNNATEATIITPPATTTSSNATTTASIMLEPTKENRVRCNAPHTWETVPILLGDKQQHSGVSAAKSSASSVKSNNNKNNHVSICLMGSKQRRRHSKPKAQLVVTSADRLRTASYDASNPTSFVLSKR